VFELKSDLT